MTPTERSELIPSANSPVAAGRFPRSARQAGSAGDSGGGDVILEARAASGHGATHLPNL